MMKKLTLVGVGVTGFGFGLPFLGLLVGLEEFIDIGNSMIAIGFIMIYIFLLAWQSEFGKKRVIVVSSLFGLFFLSMLIYSFIKGDEAEKAMNLAWEERNDLLNELKATQANLNDAESKTLSLSRKLEECNQTLSN